MIPTKETLIVTGASGHLGQRVLEYLIETRASNIIATTRSPEKLADFATRGVTVRYADFSEPESLVSAFEGGDRLLIISTDTLDVRATQQQAAIDAAISAGIKHIVYTSLIGADDTPVILADSHIATEKALADSGIGYTVLRNNVYTEMLLGTLEQARSMGGQIFSAAEGGNIAYVTRDDCAHVASAVLNSSFDGKRIVDITGPKALNLSDVAEIARELSGETFTVVDVPLHGIIDGMVQAGLPQAVARTYASFDTAAAEGKLDVVSTDFEELTGLKPTSVKSFLEANLGVFAD